MGKPNTRDRGFMDDYHLPVAKEKKQVILDNTAAGDIHDIRCYHLYSISTGGLHISEVDFLPDWNIFLATDPFIIHILHEKTLFT